MGADSQWAVQNAVTTALKNDSTLTSQLASGASSVLEAVPSSPTYPLLVLGHATAKMDDTMTDNGMDQTIYIETYSDDASTQEAKDIMAAIYDVLHDSSLSISGHDLVLFQFIESEVQIDEDDTTRRKGVQQFRVITEPS